MDASARETGAPLTGAGALYRRLFVVPRLMLKSRLRWWLVYGPVRTGTSLMLRTVASRSRLYVSDWCLGNMLQLSADYDYVRFDRARALTDISRNVLRNAYAGGGRQLDLAFKQANLRAHEYESLVRMWGEPERVIFCFREPAGYIASAMKKFPAVTVGGLQNIYVAAMKTFGSVGGEAFEYHEGLVGDDYRRFLPSLRLREGAVKFRYKGVRLEEYTTEAMWEAYSQMAGRAGRGGGS